MYCVFTQTWSFETNADTKQILETQNPAITITLSPTRQLFWAISVYSIYTLADPADFAKHADYLPNTWTNGKTEKKHLHVLSPEPQGACKHWLRLLDEPKDMVTFLGAGAIKDEQLIVTREIVMSNKVTLLFYVREQCTLVIIPTTMSGMILLKIPD